MLGRNHASQIAPREAVDQPPARGQDILIALVNRVQTRHAAQRNLRIRRHGERARSLSRAEVDDG